MVLFPPGRERPKRTAEEFRTAHRRRGRDWSSATTCSSSAATGAPARTSGEAEAAEAEEAEHERRRRSPPRDRREGAVAGKAHARTMKPRRREEEAARRRSTKRGRPPRRRSAAVEAQAEPEPPAPKKRGRPPKKPAARRRRRSPRAEPAEEEAAEETDRDSPGDPGRVRPQGPRGSARCSTRRSAWACEHSGEWSCPPGNEPFDARSCWTRSPSPRAYADDKILYLTRAS